MRTKWAVVLLALVSLLSNARAAHEEDWFSESHLWVSEVQLNTEFFGHLGTNSLGNVPKTGIFTDGHFGYWYAHTVQGYLHLSRSITGDSIWGYGFGIRLNLFELGGRSSGGNFSWNRGLLAFGPNSMLLFMDLEYSGYSFSPSDPMANYPTSQSGLLFGGGVQWAPRARPFDVSRIFLNTVIHIARLNGVLYAVPGAGIGVNF